MIGPTVWLPEIARLPLQPPEAVQEEVPLDDQVSTTEPPAATDPADALSVTLAPPLPAGLLLPPPLLLPLQAANSSAGRIRNTDRRRFGDWAVEYVMICYGFRFLRMFNTGVTPFDDRCIDKESA